MVNANTPNAATIPKSNKQFWGEQSIYEWNEYIHVFDIDVKISSSEEIEQNPFFPSSASQCLNEFHFYQRSGCDSKLLIHCFNQFSLLQLFDEFATQLECTKLLGIKSQVRFRYYLRTFDYYEWIVICNTNSEASEMYQVSIEIWICVMNEFGERNFVQDVLWFELKIYRVKF